MITEFKNKLREGEVTFKYRKTNGDIREARGTLNEKLIPEQPKFETYKLVMDWDTDDLEEGAVLPSNKLTVKIPAGYTNDAEIEHAIEVALDETIDFCYYAFTYEKVERKPKKLNENQVLYFDLNSNGYRSFKFENLISE